MPRLVIAVTREGFEATTKRERKHISRKLREVAARLLAILLKDEDLDLNGVSARWIAFDDHDNEMGLEVDLIFSIEEGDEVTDAEKESLADALLEELRIRKELHKPEFRELGVWIRPSVGGYYKPGVTIAG